MRPPPLGLWVLVRVVLHVAEGACRWRRMASCKVSTWWNTDSFWHLDAAFHVHVLESAAAWWQEPRDARPSGEAMGPCGTVRKRVRTARASVSSMSSAAVKVRETRA